MGLDMLCNMLYTFMMFLSVSREDLSRMFLMVISRKFPRIPAVSRSLQKL